MPPTILQARLRHRLIQQLALRPKHSKLAIDQGFTLIELLVVVIIVAILAAIALPSFLDQADKAKSASAKALASAGGKECQVYMLSPSDYGGKFPNQTASGDTSKITFTNTCADDGSGGSATATVVGGINDKKTAIAKVDKTGKLTAEGTLYVAAP